MPLPLTIEERAAVWERANHNVYNSRLAVSDVKRLLEALDAQDEAAVRAIVTAADLASTAPVCTVPAPGERCVGCAEPACESDRAKPAIACECIDQPGHADACCGCPCHAGK